MDTRVKYPRTPHLPNSPGGTDDDKVLKTTSHFKGSEVVVTEKCDGENTTIGKSYSHARSTSSRHHPSRNMVKSLQAQIGHQLPEGWRLCGENLYAKHSIGYTALPAFFVLFSIWDQDNRCLGWDALVEWAALLSIPTPPVIYQGAWDPKAIQAAWEGYTSPYGADPEPEGYVVRTVDGFGFEAFDQCVAKFVRKGHVQTDQHWMLQTVTPNTLKG